jgi:nucleoside-diphosphate-sugar epimerase
LARKNQAQLKTQAIYINCGQQDEYGFADSADQMHKQLLAEKVPHEFHLYPGGHRAEYFLSHLGETIEEATSQMDTNMGLLRDRIGWEPQVDLRDGLRRTLEWYEAHPEVRPAATPT